MSTSPSPITPISVEANAALGAQNFSMNGNVQQWQQHAAQQHAVQNSLPPLAQGWEMKWEPTAQRYYFIDHVSVCLVFFSGVREISKENYECKKNCVK